MLYYRLECRATFRRQGIDAGLRGSLSRILWRQGNVSSRSRRKYTARALLESCHYRINLWKCGCLPKEDTRKTEKHIEITWRLSGCKDQTLALKKERLSTQESTYQRDGRGERESERGIEREKGKEEKEPENPASVLVCIRRMSGFGKSAAEFQDNPATDVLKNICFARSHNIMVAGVEKCEVSR